jgi:hypothetical protein
MTEVDEEKARKHLLTFGRLCDRHDTLNIAVLIMGGLNGHRVLISLEEVLHDQAGGGAYVWLCALRSK